MRVLVTGADGYIGTVLGPRLVERRFDVVGVNCGFYRGGWLYNDDRPRPLTFTKDRRGRWRTQRAIDAQSADRLCQVQGIGRARCRRTHLHEFLGTLA